MSTIDNRIVDMQFNRADFLKGTEETIGALGRLEGALTGQNGIAQGVRSIGDRVSAAGILAFTAFQRLGNAAIDAGAKIVNFVMDPLFEGGKKRALNIEQARFQFEGLGMDVEASMQSALDAVRGTAYGLDEAAVVAAQFGASGMQAGDDMTASLRGIAGVAAMSGSSFSDIGNVFTKVAGQGRLMGDDLNRLGTRGVNAAATLAEYFRETGKDINATEESIRKMVTKGEIDFQTFADAMSNAFGEHATKANETYTGSLANMRAAISRIGASFATVNFERQRVIFNALTPVIDKIADALEPLIDLFAQLSSTQAQGVEKFLTNLHENFDWDSLTRTVANAARAFTHAKSAVMSFLGPIGDAFKAVFMSGGDSWVSSLADWMFNLGTWISTLKLTESEMEGLRSTSTKFFQALRNGFQNYVVPFASFLVEVARTVWDFGSAIFSLITPLADLVSGFSESLTSGEGFANVLNGITETLSKFRENGFESMGEGLLEFFALSPIEMLESLGSAIWGLLSSFGEFAASIWDLLDFAPGGWNPFEWISNALSAIAGGMASLFSFMAPVMYAIRDLVVGGLEGLANAMSDIDLTTLFGWIGQIFQIGILSSIKNLFDSAGNIFTGFSDIFSGLGGTMKSIQGMIEGVTGALKGMQNDLNASALLKIAISIGVLSASLLILSLVNPGNMAAAIGGIAALTAILMGAMAVMTKITGEFSAAKLAVISASLILMATAMLLFVASVAALSAIPMDRLIQGIVGFAAVLGLVVVAAQLLSNMGMRFIIAAVGLNLLALAIAALVPSIVILGAIPMEMMVQGLIGIGLALAGLIVAATLLSLIGPKLLIVAPALVIMAAALTILTIPIMALGSMDYDAMMQGLMGTGIALAGLVVAALALSLVGPKLLIVAPALLIMAVAMNMMMVPILALAAIPMDAMVQGLIGFGVALGALVLATALMSGSIVGAVGMILVAGAMLILAAAIRTLASVPIMGIVIALGALAAGLLIIVGASALAMLVLPGLLALAGMMIAFGVAAILVAAATLVMAVAVGVLAVALPPLVEGLLAFAKASPWIALATPLFLLIGAALLVFGAGALVAGVAAVILGAGLLALGVGMSLISANGPQGAEALLAFVDAIEPLVWKVIQIGTISVALTALGAALLVLGAGMLLGALGAVAMGAAAIVLTVGLAALIVTLRLLSSLIPKTSENFQKIGEASGPVLSFATALGTLAPILILFAEGAVNADNAMRGMRASLLAVVVTFSSLGTAVSVASAIFVTSINSMSNEASKGTVRLSAASKLMTNAVRSLSTGIQSHAPAVSASVQLMIGMIVANMNRGSVDVDTATKTISQRFVTLGLAISVAGAAVVVSVGRTVQGVSTELRTGVSLITVGVAMISTAFGQMSSRISQNGSGITSAVRTVVSNVNRTLTNSAGSIRSSAYNTGLALANGMVGGINAGRSRVSTAARSVAQSAINAANNTLGVRSPSRVFYAMMGFVVDGMVNSLGDGTPRVEKAAESVSEALIDAVEEVYRDMPDMDELFGFSPTITPILDLDEARRQAHGFRPQVGFDPYETRGQAYALAGLEAALRGVSVEKKQEKSQIIFNQNNHSPKALSESEIYRQTKNLISRLDEREGKE